MNLNSKIRGFYVYSFLDVKRMQLVYDELKNRVEKWGYLPYVFPTVGLLKDLEKQKTHFKISAQTFEIKGTKWFLKPTSEAVAYPMVYQDQTLELPFKWYSQSSVFRKETKACSKYFRGRQISFFFEAHSVFATEAQAKDEITLLIRSLKEYLNYVGIPTQVHLRPPQDKFLGAQDTYAFDTIVNNEFVQVATLHYLGTNFSKAYRKGTPLYGVCYGLSERVLGVLDSLYGKDSKYFFNPYPVVKVNIGKSEEFTSLELPTFVLERPTRKQYLKLQNKYNPLFFLKQGRTELKNNKVIYESVGENKVYLSSIDSVNEFIAQKRRELAKAVAKQIYTQCDAMNRDSVGSVVI